jgi:hypothetical protein
MNLEQKLTRRRRPTGAIWNGREMSTRAHRRAAFVWAPERIPRAHSESPPPPPVAARGQPLLEDRPRLRTKQYRRASNPLARHRRRSVSIESPIGAPPVLCPGRRVGSLLRGLAAGRLRRDCRKGPAFPNHSALPVFTWPLETRPATRDALNRNAPHSLKCRECSDFVGGRAHSRRRGPTSLLINYLRPGSSAPALALAGPSRGAAGRPSRTADALCSICKSIDGGRRRRRSLSIRRRLVADAGGQRRSVAAATTAGAKH